MPRHRRTFSPLCGKEAKKPRRPLEKKPGCRKRRCNLAMAGLSRQSRTPNCIDIQTAKIQNSASKQRLIGLLLLSSVNSPGLARSDFETMRWPSGAGYSKSQKHKAVPGPSRYSRGRSRDQYPHGRRESECIGRWARLMEEEECRAHRGGIAGRKRP